MDLATLIGLAASLGVLGYGIWLGGNVEAFVDLPAVLIVIFGSVFVTLTAFSLPQMLGTGSVLAKAFVHRLPDVPAEAVRLLKLAQKSRQNGLLNIQRDVAGERNLFLRQGLVLAVDGMAPDLIERVLRSDTMAMLERHAVGMGVLRRMAETAPALGLVATLIGLVQMLGNLDNPDTIGPAMAVALLGTFYGAVMAYVILMPLASKLERASAEELQLRKVYTAAVLGIARQENPRQIELQINAILPPGQRISVFRG